MKKSKFCFCSLEKKVNANVEKQFNTKHQLYAMFYVQSSHAF